MIPYLTVIQYHEGTHKSFWVLELKSDYQKSSVSLFDIMLVMGGPQASRGHCDRLGISALRLL